MKKELSPTPLAYTSDVTVLQAAIVALAATHPEPTRLLEAFDAACAGVIGGTTDAGISATDTMASVQQLRSMMAKVIRAAQQG